MHDQVFHPPHLSDSCHSADVTGWVLNLSEVFLVSFSWGDMYRRGWREALPPPRSLLQGTSVDAGKRSTLPQQDGMSKEPEEGGGGGFT